MNIDTQSNIAVNELTNFSSSYVQKSSGDSGFKDHLKSLSSNEKSETNKSENKSSGNKSEVDKKEETKASETKKTEDKKADKEAQVKEEKAQNADNNKKAENQQNEKNSGGQNQQNQQGQQNPEYTSLAEELQNILKTNGLSMNTNLQNKFYSGIHSDVYTSAPKINYQTISMDDNDALFFSDLVKNTNMSMSSIAGEFEKASQMGDIQQVQKTAKVSSTLMNALSDSMKTNQPFRIDFGKDVSVILRVDKDGNLNANFIPGDKAVEAYLKQNISFLKQRMDEQDLPYNELTYSKNKQQNQENEKRNNKEKDNE